MIVSITLDVYPESQNPNDPTGLRDPGGLMTALAEYGEIVSVTLIEQD